MYGNHALDNGRIDSSIWARPRIDAALEFSSNAGMDRRVEERYNAISPIKRKEKTT